MGCGDTETPPPPDILLFHILPRVPGKSVHRFLFVCKQWQSFLTTPTFAKMHQHHHKLLITLSTTTPCKFSTINLEAPQDGLTASRPLPFEASHEHVQIIGSARGLVCLRMINKCNGRIYTDIILWNPLTGEYKTVPRPNVEKCHVTTAKIVGLYYSCDDYKLLLVTKDCNVYIYSLKSDSWRHVETTEEESSFLPTYTVIGYRNIN
ncbi:putative F-box/kelch-repeat protein At1g62270 [Cynara cardunculus var. scolymus]|uniref:putative F-box/kelch-repeat protein At1g62270 n=1 Tax=Cynara cardunculus var. scolymus TaxID=59895 RepID=UPI000D624FB6|nr:putative F-box/kelch-repeat protein At1g62270 [Cynara cardunculus var. scolymus]